MLITRIKKYFTQGHTRSLEAKKNIAASFLIKGMSIISSLLIVPMTIKYVDPTQYGIWLALSSIIGWFTFFDIGFGNGLRNKFAQAKATGNTSDARIYISTTYGILLIIFSLVWLLFFIANYFVDWSVILNSPPEMANELSTLAIIVFSFFCIQIVLKVLNIVLIADQKPAKSAFIDFLGQLMALIIIFVLTQLTEGSLINLGLAFGFSPLFILIISTLWLYNNKYKPFSPSLKLVNFTYAKEIMSLGTKFFIIQIAAIVIYQTTNIIITQICGPKEVTVYNIAFKYFGILTMGFNIILAPFWSSFTDAQALNDFDWMNRTLRKLKLAWLGLSLGALILLILANTAYTFWIGDIIKIPFHISVAVCIYVIVFNWCAIFSQITSGLGKIKLQLYAAIIASLLNIPLSIFLGFKFGIAGIISSGILLSLTSAIWNPIQVKRILNKTASGIWND